MQENVGENCKLLVGEPRNRSDLKAQKEGGGGFGFADFASFWLGVSVSAFKT